MSKLTRFAAKIFGSAAGLDQVAQFGSLAAGSPAFTTDPATAQSLSNWLTGWFGAVIGGNAPAIEDMNAAFFVISYQIAYAMQAGVPEWDSGTTYYIGSFVNSGGVIYCSLTDNNLNNLVSDTANWVIVAGQIMTALGDLIYGGASGAATRLAGNTASTRSMLTQTGNGAGSSAAPSWQEVKAPTIQKFLTGSGTYTKPANVVWVRVRLVGAGGGGSGGGSSAGNGTGGGNSTFGSSLLSAVGGSGGNALGGLGGAGGSSSLGSGPIGIAFSGGTGSGYAGGGVSGGIGASSPFAGGGAASSGGTSAGGAPPANSGCGGGGGGQGGGTGGGAGGYVDAIITNPSATYAYSVGAGGAGGSPGTGGGSGGAGADGLIIVEEHYQ